MIHREYIWLHDVFSSTSRPQITASLSLQGWNIVTLNQKKYLIIFHVTLLLDLFSALVWCCHHESYKMSFVVLSLVYFLFSPIFWPLNTFTFVSLFVKILWTFNILLSGLLSIQFQPRNCCFPLFSPKRIDGSFEWFSVFLRWNTV